jgi:hypothetical protein
MKAGVDDVAADGSHQRKRYPTFGCHAIIGVTIASFPATDLPDGLFFEFAV